VSVLAFSYSRALFAIERADLDFYVNCIAVAVMLTLGLWAVRHFGPTGAAMSLLTANLATAVARYVGFVAIVRPTSGRRSVEPCAII
jgi:O-antigen/teichoic acid export membrane protein